MPTCLQRVRRRRRVECLCRRPALRDGGVCTQTTTPLAVPAVAVSLQDDGDDARVHGHLHEGLHVHPSPRCRRAGVRWRDLWVGDTDAGWDRVSQARTGGVQRTGSGGDDRHVVAVDWVLFLLTRTPVHRRRCDTTPCHLRPSSAWVRRRCATLDDVQLPWRSSRGVVAVAGVHHGQRPTSPDGRGARLADHGGGGVSQSCGSVLI